MMQIVSRDLTQQYISNSYQDVVQRYTTGSIDYLLNGLGYVILSIPSSSIGNSIITQDQVISQSISSSHSNISDQSVYSETSFFSATSSYSIYTEFSDTASLSIYSEYVGSASYSGTSTSSSYATSASWTPGVTVNSSSWASSSISASYSAAAEVAYALNFVPVSSMSASWVSESVRIINAESASYVPNLYPQIEQISSSWASSSISSSYALTASYSLNGNSTGTTLTTGSTYPITSSWSNNSNTSSYVISASQIQINDNSADSNAHKLTFGPFDVGGAYPGQYPLAVGNITYRPSTDTLFVQTASCALITSSAELTNNIIIIGTAYTDYPTLSSEFLLSTGWTSGSTDWSGSFETGFTHIPGASNTSSLFQSNPAVNGTKYQINYTITNRTTGTITINFASQSIVSISATGVWGPTATSIQRLNIVPTATFNGTVVMSIKSITAISNPVMTIQSSEGTSRIEIRASSGSTGNTCIGIGAGRYITTGQNNSSIGYQSLYSNTTGQNNSSIGYQSLYSNTTGQQNSAVGYASLYSNTTGQNNSVVGYQSLYSNTTGDRNSVVGMQSLYFNTTGIYNSAIGMQSLYSNTTGQQNSTVGYQSLYSNTTGQYNSTVGYASLYSNTTGQYNSVIGYQAGRYIADGTTANVSGSNCVFLGANAYPSRSNDTNEIVIGYNSRGKGSNTVVLGNDSITNTYLKGQVSCSQVTASTATFSTGLVIPTINGPASGTQPKGYMTFDTGSNMMYIYNGTTWKSSSFA
jgi:hypothetical protein